MYKLYLAQSIDVNLEEARNNIKIYKKVFSKFSNIEVYGAGFGDSPIIEQNSSDDYKGIVAAYDLRLLRQCDILVVDTDVNTFAAGTFMELEYARQLGLFIIVVARGSIKNIFIQTYAHRIVQDTEQLGFILSELK